MRRHWQHHRGRHGPPTFVRKFGCFFAALLVASAGIAASVARLDNKFVIIATALAFAIALSGAFTVAIRRVAGVFRAQDALRRQLMADIAHELRTPLAILQGRVEGLIDGVYPRDDAHLAELLDETRHLSRLVEDLRTIANAEAGALDLRSETVDAAELIRDAAASFEGVEVDASGPIEIELDPVRIREVLLNLLTNAVRAGGAVRVVAEPQPSQLVIRVSDTGPGIPSEELPRIFERFVKGRDSRGTGLGLAIAKNARAGSRRHDQRGEPGRGGDDRHRDPAEVMWSAEARLRFPITPQDRRLPGVIARGRARSFEAREYPWADRHEWGCGEVPPSGKIVADLTKMVRDHF